MTQHSRAGDSERDGSTSPGVVHGHTIEGRRLTLFEDRYGVGAHRQLLSWLAQPCVTFAEIATRFKVSRERVRQWHLEFMPGAPDGQDRRRACAAYRQKKRLLGDPLFGTFYRHARQHLEARRIELVKGKAGYRTRVVRFDRRLVAIRAAARHEAAPASAPTYRLARDGGNAEFIYFRLSAQDFLMVPAFVLPPHGATFTDGNAPRYQRFKNTFEALHMQSSRSISFPREGSHV